MQCKVCNCDWLWLDIGHVLSNVWLLCMQPKRLNYIQKSTTSVTEAYVYNYKVKYVSFITNNIEKLVFYRIFIGFYSSMFAGYCATF